MKTSASILVIVILVLVLVSRGQQMQEQVDRRSDAIEAKLDRLGAQLGAVHDLSVRTDAQAARIESKLDKLLDLVEKSRAVPMEPAP